MKITQIFIFRTEDNLEKEKSKFKSFLDLKRNTLQAWVPKEYRLLLICNRFSIRGLNLNINV